MPAQYAAERSALIKILLHATAHPSQAVNGLLLGKIAADAASGGSVEIVDALPLFHTYLSLAPMTEVALLQADAYARSQKLQIVGCYHANERVDDLDLGPGSKKFADRIQSNTPEACALLVDNSTLSQYLQHEAPSFLQLYIREGQRNWQQVPDGIKTPDAAAVPKLFLDYFGEGRHRELTDFDDHLNDISRNWLNTGLLA